MPKPVHFSLQCTTIRLPVQCSGTNRFYTIIKVSINYMFLTKFDGMGHGSMYFQSTKSD